MKIFKIYKSWGCFLASFFRLRKYRIGLSLILANRIELSEGVKIGHFNIIIVDKLVMKKNSSIGHFNFIKGWFDLIMEERSSIHLQNKIARILSQKKNYCKSVVHLKYHAKIGVKHEIDATRDITIGDNSMLQEAEVKYGLTAFILVKSGIK